MAASYLAQPDPAAPSPYGQPGQTYVTDPAGPSPYGQQYSYPDPAAAALASYSQPYYSQAAQPPPYGGYSAYSPGQYAGGGASYTTSAQPTYASAQPTYASAPTAGSFTYSPPQQSSYPVAASTYAAPEASYTYSTSAQPQASYTTSYAEAPRAGSFTSYPQPAAGSFTYTAPSDPYGGAAGYGSYPTTTTSYTPAASYPTYGGAPSYGASYQSPLLQPPVPASGSFVASAPQFQFYPETSGYGGPAGFGGAPGYSTAPGASPAAITGTDAYGAIAGAAADASKLAGDPSQLASGTPGAPPTKPTSTKPGGKAPHVSKKKKKMCCC